MSYSRRRKLSTQVHASRVGHKEVVLRLSHQRLISVRLRSIPTLDVLRALAGFCPLNSVQG